MLWILVWRRWFLVPMLDQLQHTTDLWSRRRFKGRGQKHQAVESGPCDDDRVVVTVRSALFPSGLCVPFVWAVFATSALSAPFLAIVEVDHAHVRRGIDALPSRVSFFDVASGRLSGRIQTIEVPYVARAPDSNSEIARFLVATHAAAPWSKDAASRGTILTEYDARRNRVMDRYRHPLPLVVFHSPSQRTGGVSMVRCGVGKLVWMATSTAKEPTHNEPQIEALNWSTKQVIFRYALPQSWDNRFNMFPWDEGCLVLYQAPAGRHARAVFLAQGGDPKPVELGLGAGENVPHVVVMDDYAIGVTTDSGRVVTIRRGPDDQLKVRAELGRFGDQAALLRPGSLTRVGDALLVASGLQPALDRALLFDPKTWEIKRNAELPVQIQQLFVREESIFGIDATDRRVVRFSAELQQETSVKLEQQMGDVVVQP